MDKINKVLATSKRIARLLTDGFQANRSADNSIRATWAAEITFDTGDVLEVLETHKISGSSVQFGFNYHFMDVERKCRFRLDTHGQEYPPGEPCHVHVGENEQIVENGSGRLCGYGLERIDFLVAFHLANQFLKGRKLPWD